MWDGWVLVLIAVVLWAVAGLLARLPVGNPVPVEAAVEVSAEQIDPEPQREPMKDDAVAVIAVYPRKCMECHDEGAEVALECSSCHSAVAPDKAPADHVAGWNGRHGLEARFDDSCVWCHGENSCDDCHQGVRPTSHNPTWTLSGHGREADFDRRQCDTCHQADQCDRCHQVKPMTHVSAGFRFGGHSRLIDRRGGTRSCNVCHEADTCNACHD